MLVKGRGKGGRDRGWWCWREDFRVGRRGKFRFIFVGLV